MGLGTRARRALGALTCMAAVTIPLSATAQPFSDEHVQGVVISFDGQERLTLRDDRGYVDDVSLGYETRISPEGTRIVPGMRLALTGYNGGKWFDATAIQVLAGGSAPPSDTPSYAQPSEAYDAPYGYAAPVYAYPVPVYAYPVPVYAYPAPAYAYPYYYGPYYRAYRPYYGSRVTVGVRVSSGHAWVAARGWHR